MAWPSITTTSAMNTAYECAVTTGAFEREESPGKGPKGPRDSSGAKKTVRAILKKKGRPQGNKILFYKAYDGAIINPPVP
jgi:hypothetical protein